MIYENWLAGATVAMVTVGTVALAALVHYEGLVCLSQRLRRKQGRDRIKVLYAVLSVIALHVAETWLFGVVFWLLLQWPECGYVEVVANVAGPFGFFDALYLSATTFTTLGFGDLAPVGPIRFLISTEAVTGLVLIAWSASFTYLEMERFWRKP